MIYDIKWNDTIIKDFKATDEGDLGEVHDIANGHTLVQTDAIDKENFTFPKTKHKVMKV